MEAEIIFQGLDEPPKGGKFGRPFIDASATSKITFVCIQGGMASGEPSVMIISETSHGPIFLQTSLDKFLMAAQAMSSGAKYHWSWEMPEGNVTLLPVGDETRKALLESIKKELEEDE